MNSRSYKIALWAFIFSLFYIGLGLIQKITWGDKSFEFRSADASLIMALLGPSFGLYFGRKFTDAKYLSKDADGKKE